MSARRKKGSGTRRPPAKARKRSGTRKKSRRKGGGSRSRKKSGGKVASKKAASRRGARSSRTRRPPASRALGDAVARKLDPRLAPAAARAAEEKPAGRARRRRARGSGTVRPPASGTIRPPAALPSLQVGMQSLVSQVSERGAARLLSQDRVTVLVDAPDREALAQRLAAEGIPCQPVGRTTLRVEAPRRRLAEIAGLRQVQYVEASARLRPKNDLAGVSANLLQNASNLRRQVSQTGRGVLVGIVDTGIDAGHPGFRSGNASRIVDYLDQTADPDRRHSSGSGGGIAIGRATSQSPDTDGHGTHVAGIAAGGGGGSPRSRFAGVAPEADLAVVKTTFETPDIAAAVDHVFQLAAQREQPCVVNLSLGGHVGPHDGSSVVECTIDQLCEEPGRIVVVAAGNEGDAALHAGTVIDRTGDPPYRWVADFEINPQETADGERFGHAVVQVWTQREDRLRVTLRSPDGDLIAAPTTGLSSVERSHFIVDAIGQTAPYSGDRSDTFEIFTVASPQVLRGWSLVVTAESSDDVQVGAVHAWLADDGMGRFTNGAARSHLVGMPGTAFSAVTVASYATRSRWETADADNPTIDPPAIRTEDISYFSSPGPSRDGHNKPEVAAPGHWLVSALSSQATLQAMPLEFRLPDEKYAALRGTSMATPFVTGAIALLLEKEGFLHWAEAKRRIIKAVKQDRFTWPCWNQRWGYGKLDVQRLLTVES